MLNLVKIAQYTTCGSIHTAGYWVFDIEKPRSNENAAADVFQNTRFVPVNQLSVRVVFFLLQFKFDKSLNELKLKCHPFRWEEIEKDKKKISKNRLLKEVIIKLLNLKRGAGKIGKIFFKVVLYSVGW